MLKDRLKTYTKDQCWQYSVREDNLEEDLILAGLSKEYTDKLRVPDFDFKSVTVKKEQKILKEFIERHEWLGNLSQFTTHWFACYHKDILAGVILFNMPNAFSKLLGDDTKNLERLISRGACISWSPKNLASSFLMWCIGKMVRETQYRLFTAYSDPTAKELGTIYQACNFYYLGQRFGTATNYINPYSGAIVSDRYFRQVTAYRKYTLELGIEWQKNWSHNSDMLWNNVPDNIEAELRAYSKKKKAASQKVTMPLKHKYAYVLGRDKRETRALRALFQERNKILPYPKDRGK